MLGRLRRGYRVFRLRMPECGTRINLCYLLVKIKFGSEHNEWLSASDLREKLLAKEANLQTRESNLLIQTWKRSSNRVLSSSVESQGPVVAAVSSEASARQPTVRSSCCSFVSAPSPQPTTKDSSCASSVVAQQSVATPSVEASKSAFQFSREPASALLPERRPHRAAKTEAESAQSPPPPPPRRSLESPTKPSVAPSIGAAEPLQVTAFHVSNAPTPPPPPPRRGRPPEPPPRSSTPKGKTGDNSYGIRGRSPAAPVVMSPGLAGEMLAQAEAAAAAEAEAEAAAVAAAAAEELVASAQIPPLTPDLEEQRAQQEAQQATKEAAREATANYAAAVEAVAREAAVREFAAMEPKKASPAADRRPNRMSDSPNRMQALATNVSPKL